MGYVQCMAAKGNNVPTGVAYLPPYSYGYPYPYRSGYPLRSYHPDWGY